MDRTIPREVFWPRPDVASALLVIRPRESGKPGAAAVKRPEGFARFAKALFSQRRKLVRSAAANAAPHASKQEIEAALAAAGIYPGSRAEEIAPKGLLGLWRELGG